MTWQGYLGEDRAERLADFSFVYPDLGPAAGGRVPSCNN
jgi:hypothetical protein